MCSLIPSANEKQVIFLVYFQATVLYQHLRAIKKNNNLTKVQYTHDTRDEDFKEVSNSPWKQADENATTDEKMMS